MHGSQVEFPRPWLIYRRYIINVFCHFDNRIGSPLLCYPLIMEMKL